MYRRRRGRIFAVCANTPQNECGSLKLPQTELVIGSCRCSHIQGVVTDSLPHVTILAYEVLEAVNKELGIELKPGFLGEDITVRGLGDLSDVTPGAEIVLEGGVVLKVTARLSPVGTLSKYHEQLPEKLAGKRGFVATVI